MKKKLLAVVLCLALVMTTMACGSSKETDKDKANAERIKELKEELAELEESQSEESEAEEDEDEPTEEFVQEEEVIDESETWTDDTSIVFTDADMLSKVREITGISERDITYGDVKNITEFSGSYSEITPIKYFTSLVTLNIGTTNNADLDMFKNLKSLKTLTLSASSVTDFKGLSSCENLTDLTFHDCEGLTEIKLEGLPNLTNLAIETCDEVAAIHTTGEFPNLTTMYVDSGMWSDNLTDISPIGNLTNLTYLDIGGDSLTDVSVICNLQNIGHISIKGPNLKGFDYYRIVSEDTESVSERNPADDLAYEEKAEETAMSVSWSELQELIRNTQQN
jgi:internalin A